VAIYEFFDPTWYASNATGFRCFADILFGANGALPWMVPEVTAGSSTENADSASTVWDEDLEDGFDSGQIGVNFAADLSSGTTTLTAGSGAAVSHAGPTGGAVGSVLIRAAAQVDGDVEWSGLTITFWNDEVAVETISPGGFEADGTSSSSDEQILRVTPSASGCDRVTVTGSLRMHAAPQAYLESTSLFGQILVKPAV
jgi:hypothetical protein